MAEVVNRDEKEVALAKPIAKEFNRFRNELVKIIPELDEWARDVPQKYWDEHAQNLLKAINPLLIDIFISHARTSLDVLQSGKGFGVDWGLVNERAADWARGYGKKLVDGIVKTGQKVVRKVLPLFFEEQWTLKDLRQALSVRFDANSAAMIAATETTRAANEGQMAISQEILAQGIPLKPYWLTAKDDKVCPICKPLGMSDGFYNERNEPVFPHPATGVLWPKPPAHPNCRCDYGDEVVWD